MKLKELTEKRVAVIAQMNAMHTERAEKWSADDQTAFGALDAQVQTLEGQIANCQRMTTLTAAQSAPAGRSTIVLPGGNAPANIGLTRRELAGYSLTRAINAAATQNWNAAGFELECSRAVQTLIGSQPQGFYVPNDFLQHREDPLPPDYTMLQGIPTQGGNLVATNLLAQSFIDLLRNRMVTQQAGAMILSGLVGDIAIPRQSGGATCYWVGENAAPPKSGQLVDQVPLSPKTIGAYTDISRKLLMQASMDVEAMTRRDLAKVLALGIDQSSFYGTGLANDPKGLAHIVGVAPVIGGDNGALPTWGNIIDLETAVAAANADIGSLAYVTNAKVRGFLKQQPKVPDFPMFIWGDDPQPLNGYGAFVSNQIPSNLVKGLSGAVCSSIFYGNWDDLIIGMWGALDVLVDPFSNSTSGTVRVVVFQSVDVNVRHPESFAMMADALTTAPSA